MKMLEQRFWEKVDIKSKDECWSWLASKHARGYGQFYIGNHIPEAHPKRGTMHYATHISFYLEHGRWINKGNVVMHTCDNPNCVNPKHLIEGTQQDNVADRESKGRNKPRIRIPLKIHKAIKNSPKAMTHAEVAKKHGVSSGHVSRVRRGLTRAYE